MKAKLTALLILLLPAMLVAGGDGPTGQALSPAELAAESDLVVLVQLDRVDYEHRRGFPVKGRAWLRVLVRYKVPEPIDLVRLVEEGFGNDRCYFDEIRMWEEMPRYLLFANHAEGSSFRGNRNGCRLEVLVTRDSQYAVRWPQSGLHLDNEGEALVQELTFHGPGATIDVRELTATRKQDLAERYLLEDRGDNRYAYTRGILLEDFRTLLGPENLTRSRQQRGN